MWECWDCGRQFKEPNVHWYTEDRGYYGSSRAYEEVADETCPYCGGPVMELEEDEEDEEWDEEE